MDWKKGPSQKQVFAGFIIIGGVVVLALLIYSAFLPSGNSGRTEPSSQHSTLLMPGDDAHVVPGSPILLPLDEATEEEVVKLSVAKDEIGLSKLVLSGRAVLVPGGTKVKVIEVNGILDVKCRIRILEGDEIGQSGWVPANFIGK